MAALCWSSCEEIPHAQGKRNPSKTVCVAREHQRPNTLKSYSQKTSQSNHTRTTALSNSMKVSLARGATQDGRVMVERSDRMWSTGEGNGKILHYSCLENPMNSMKRQNDRKLKEKLFIIFALRKEKSSFLFFCFSLQPFLLTATWPFPLLLPRTPNKGSCLQRKPTKARKGERPGFLPSPEEGCRTTSRIGPPLPGRLQRAPLSEAAEITAALPVRSGGRTGATPSQTSGPLI